jgi:hypothetical protein
LRDEVQQVAAKRIRYVTENHEATHPRSVMIHSVIRLSFDSVLESGDLHIHRSYRDDFPDVPSVRAPRERIEYAKALPELKYLTRFLCWSR